MPATRGGEAPDPTMLANLVEQQPEIVLELAVEPPSWAQIPDAHRRLLRGAASSLGGTEPALLTVLDRILMQEDPEPSLQWFRMTGVLEHLLPELFDTVNLSDESERRHKHVWDHTLQVIRQCPMDRIVRWAALFHDIGKVKTREFGPSGKVTFYGHDIVGAGMFRGIARRLGLEKSTAKTVYNLIKFHLRPGQYESSWTDSAVRRMGKEIGEELWLPLLELGRADITSKRPGKREAALRRIDELADRVAQIRELDARIPPLPKGLGNLIMEQAGVPAGPLLGAVIRWLEAEVEAERILPHQEGGYYLEFLASCPILERKP